MEKKEKEEAEGQAVQKLRQDSLTLCSETGILHWDVQYICNLYTAKF